MDRFHQSLPWRSTRNFTEEANAHNRRSSIPPWRSTRNFKEEANAHNRRNIVAEQHVYWQEQGRNALKFQQSVFERATQEFGQAARDEVHASAAQATEMYRAEMWDRMGARENQAEQIRTSHQVTLLNEMNSVAGDHGSGYQACATRLRR